MTAYEGRAILCRKCLDRPMEERELMDYLDQYAASLPREERASEAAYARRLAQCAACPQRLNEMCRLCGCYVQARAAKKRLRCPMPGNPRWLEEG